MRPCRTLIAPAAILILSAGCATDDFLSSSAFASDEATTRPAVVEVENNNFADMRVYAHRAGVRQWLGRVPSLSTRSFQLPAEWSGALDEIRLTADAWAAPEGYRSDPFRVRGNQVVEFRIEDPITISRISIWNGR